MEATAKFVKEITVEDPDTGSPIEVEVYKHENGGMFAIDSSFLDQTKEAIFTAIPDPFGPFGAATLLILQGGPNE